MERFLHTASSRSHNMTTMWAMLCCKVSSSHHTALHCNMMCSYSFCKQCDSPYLHTPVFTVADDWYRTGGTEDSFGCEDYRKILLASFPLNREQQQERRSNPNPKPAHDDIVHLTPHMIAFVDAKVHNLSTVVFQHYHSDQCCNSAMLVSHCAGCTTPCVIIEKHIVHNSTLRPQQFHSCNVPLCKLPQSLHSLGSSIKCCLSSITGQILVER